MPRIVGVDIPDKKRIEIAIRYIYGIGPINGQKILEIAKIDPNKRARELNEQEVANIRAAIETLGVRVEGELRRLVVQDIKRLKEIQCYRGTRHQKNLPSRGQKTQKNARTRRGKKVAIGGVNLKAVSKK